MYFFNVYPIISRPLFYENCKKTLPIAEQQRWLDWAIWICAKFQRTSSAVEGRNGYLSALHHSNRGFTPQTLKVLTIIHNFDIKRADGSTAAQRLFLHPFPDLLSQIASQNYALSVRDFSCYSSLN
jgi:hypothetical protein